jgi:P27 family predicted phage terminase small subunit
VGLRGPPPKPRALAIAEGNPGERPLNGFEPEPRKKRPKCPPHLSEEARREWRRLVPILERMRVLTEADGLALANLCMQYSTMIKAQRLLEKSGLLFKTKSGYVQQSPLVAIVASCVDQVSKLCRDFGLTPASRTRLTVEKEANSDDELWDLLLEPRPPRPDCASAPI